MAGGAEAAPGLHLVGQGLALTGAVHAAGHDAVALVAAVTGAGRLDRAVQGLRRRLPLPA